MQIPIVTQCKYLDVIVSEHNISNDLFETKLLIWKIFWCSVKIKSCSFQMNVLYYFKSSLFFTLVIG